VEETQRLFHRVSRHCGCIQKRAARLYVITQRDAGFLAAREHFFGLRNGTSVRRLCNQRMEPNLWSMYVTGKLVARSLVAKRFASSAEIDHGAIEQA